MTMPNNLPRSQRSTEYVDPPVGWEMNAIANMPQAGRMRDGKPAKFSEFSHGPGLTTQELKDASPAAGGRYRGHSPASEPIPNTGQIIEHIWGNELIPPPKHYPRTPYDD